MGSLVPTEEYESEIDGRTMRIRVFHSTKEWSRGDLLEVDGKPAIFSCVELYEEMVLHYNGLRRWANRGGLVILFNSEGLWKLDADEFARVEQTIRLVNRIKDCEAPDDV